MSEPKCAECNGTGLIEGWPVLPGDPVVSEPMTATNQNPAPFHRCSDCNGTGEVTTDGLQ